MRTIVEIYLESDQILGYKMIPPGDGGRWRRKQNCHTDVRWQE